MKIVKKGSYKQSFILGSAIIMVLSYGYFFNTGLLIGIKNYSIAPFLYLQSSTNDVMQTWNDYCTYKKNLLAERNFYKKRSQELQGSLVAFKAQLQFNSDTDELIEYKKNYSLPNARLARILLKHIDNEEHFFLINLGEDEDIVVDSAVVYKNCLLGKVTQVYPSYSKVVLVTDRHCRAAVFCTETKTPGIYEGTCSKDSALLNHVSHMQPLQLGDIMLSAGEGLIFPYGFGVGTIESFEQKGIQYEVKVKPMVDIDSIDYCYVLPVKNMAFSLKE